jgi:CBS domain-containing protein
VLTREVMSREVLAIRRDATLPQAVRLMLDKRISGLPVVDEAGHVVGVLTEGDLLRRAETGTAVQGGWLANLFASGAQAGRYVQAHTRRVADLMTPEVVSVAEDTPLSEVVRLMERYRIKRLPVLRDAKLVGLVSRADLVRAVGEAMVPAALTADDATIVQRIREELGKQPWAHARSLSIACENGEVVLDGCVFDMRERDAVRVLAESIPGVKSVDNRLACVEPNTGTMIYGG